MWYAIIGEDEPGSLASRLATREAHLDRIRQLQAEGRVLLAGPMPAIDAADPGPAGYAGSLMVLEFSSLAEAQAWAAADPYVSAGVFRKVAAHPFRKVFPEHG